MFLLVQGLNCRSFVAKTAVEITLPEVQSKNKNTTIKIRCSNLMKQTYRDGSSQILSNLHDSMGGFHCLVQNTVQNLSH